MDAQFHRQRAVGIPAYAAAQLHPANNGDTRRPVRPFLNPALAGSAVTRNPNQWFDPNALIAPPSNSGFYGNVGRNGYRGPGPGTWDFSAIKDARVSESVRLQFRLEIVNVLNRVNFNIQNLIFPVRGPADPTFPESSPTAGQVPSTSTSSRQIQLGLKLLW